MVDAKIRPVLARVCELAIGLVFIVGALPKALDINRFSVQMSAYQVITDKALLPWFALATLFAEMALGAALLLGLRLRGVVILALELMLAVFTGLILYAWLVHGLEDCGCFPLVKMTPPVSIAKNVALFLLGLVVWRWLVRGSANATGGAEVSLGTGDSVPPKPGTSVGFGMAVFLSIMGSASWRGAALRFILAFAAAAAAVGYAAPRVEHVASVEEAGIDAGIDYAQFVFDTDMGSYDLGKGAYLVPILSMTCEECMGKVPLLNELMSQPGMPPMVALCYEDKPGDLDNFRTISQPYFPLHALGDQPLLYFNLRGEDPFRLTLIGNGRALAHWDGRVPEAREVGAALAAPGNAPAK